MLYIHLAALSGILLFIICYLLSLRTGKYINKPAVFFLFAAAFLLRLYAAGISRGFDSDTVCFAAWSERIFLTGPSGFYSPVYFSDYPPGYLLLLWPIGALRNLLGLEYYSTAHLILLRLPAILCDLLCGLLLYREASKRYQNRLPVLFSAVYLFNPAILLNSAVWGQVDSVYTLCLVVMCLSLMGSRLFPALTAFGLGLVIKPQMLIFTPVLFVGILDIVFLQHFTKKGLLSFLRSTVLSLLLCLLTVLPFGLQNVWNQYFSTLSSYPYAAVNACNLWGLLGFNWVSQDTALLGIPCRFYGFLAIVAAVILTLFISFRKGEDKTKYPLLCAVLMSTVFLFSVRMHERYLYAAIILLIFACICQPSAGLGLCYGGLSILHFYNTAWVLFCYDPANYDRKNPIILLVSAGMLYFYFLLLRESLRQTKQKRSPLLIPAGGLAPRPSVPINRLDKYDLLCMLLITFLYGCFALYDLGDLSAPQTVLQLEAGDSIDLTFESKGSPVLPERMAYYLGPEHNRSFMVSEWNPDTNQWENSNTVTLKNVFTWQVEELFTDAAPARLRSQDTDHCRIRLTATGKASLMELVFLDSDGNVLTPSNAGDYPALFDEQQLYPCHFSFRNSMYFDEIYHGRTAYEMLHGYNAYENTHPPLGKILISAGVALLGMTPFGWRIAGTVFGIIMVPLLYLFAKSLTGNRSLTALACSLFAFDFMHFTQTRIATIDVFVTFFILLMYLFMYRYSCMSFYDTALRKTFLPLGACGLCFGLGVACKWTGIYAGFGLAVIFFGLMYQRYCEYIYAGYHPTKETAGISHRKILEQFIPNLWKTILFCLAAFVFLPLIIYLLSYLPFQDGTGDNLLLRFLHNQQNMLSYHTDLVSTHPFASPCYDWPILKRPVWYYSGILTGSYGSGGLREGISAFGNPLVWWVGIPAFLYCFYLATEKKDRTAAFLITGYLAQYLPWFFVSRITFIYHYFPSTIFVVLMIVHSFQSLRDHMPPRSFKLLLLLYGSSAIGLFLLFYPVLSGQPVDSGYVEQLLRWFDSWVLTAK
ncbi:MAG: phospholipid carrier-dependent glycosyltransferase [Acetatifactor sp.]